MSNTFKKGDKVRVNWGRNKGYCGIITTVFDNKQLVCVDFNRSIRTSDGDKYPDFYYVRFKDCGAV